MFYWPALDRQVRVEGDVEQVTAAESDAYFAVRPRGSQVAGGRVAAVAAVGVARRAAARIDAVEASLDGAAPPRPASRGGYRVVPHTLEFWQGQPSRSTIAQYRRGGAGWSRTRLAP